MLSSQEVLQHWNNCQSPKNPCYDQYLKIGKEIVNKYAKWELVEVPVNQILNYQDTVLEFSGPLITKIEQFSKTLKCIADLPIIVLIPIDKINKMPFIEDKYDSPDLKWQVADGVHRLHLIIRLGLNSIKAFIPVEDK